MITTTEQQQKRIHILPIQLANQIAAGEVIERPASVVKELLENSLDANATTIEIKIENGGQQLISINDNGDGIHPDDLVLALSRHGTSKIKNFTDLEQIASLGFRGEALASICSVSRLTLASCQQGTNAGWKISAEGNQFLEDICPAAQPPGTLIQVRDLFFNTPARRKFLRSEKTEFSYIEEMVKKIALARFDLRIQLEHNQRTVFLLTPAQTEIAQEQRLAKLCGKDLVANSVKIDVEINGLHLHGWLSLPSFTLAQQTQQYFYVNGRVIRDKVITHAIRQAYENSIPTGRHPAFVLFLQLDPGSVDVNVHPTKHEVRFREQRLIHDFIVRAVSHGLKQTVQETVLDEISSPVFVTEKIPESEVQSLPRDNQDHYYTPTERHFPKPNLFEAKEELAAYTTLNYEQPSKPIATHTKTTPQLPTLGQAICLLHETFILVEKPAGLIIVDAVLAIEQITYHRLTQQWENSSCLLSQPLLFPESLRLDQNQITLLTTQQELLMQLGIAVESMGHDMMLLRQAPSELKNVVFSKFFADVCQIIKDHASSTSPDLINQLLLLIAKHHAKQRKISHNLIELNNLLQDLAQADKAEMANNAWREFSMMELHKLIG